MTMYAIARLAWSATFGGVVAAWIYLTAIPTTGTYWLDNTVAIAVVIAGFLAAAFIERRVEIAFGMGRDDSSAHVNQMAPIRERVGARAS